MSNLERKWITTNENLAVALMRKTNNLPPFKWLICLVSMDITGETWGILRQAVTANRW